MASKDTTLFNTPRASHFGLLISSDEEGSDRENSSPEEGSDLTNPDAAKFDDSLQAENKAAAAGSVSPDSNDNSSHWSYAKVKTSNKKISQPQGHYNGNRSTGFSRGNAFTPGTSQLKRAPIAPLTVEMLNPEQTLEIHNFAETWRTNDIKKAFQAFEGQYKLKWQNDTSCFVHFETAERAAEALEQVKSEEASLRRFSPENLAPVNPKPDLSQIGAENAFEVYAFPASWHSNELNQLLTNFNGKYRLKWRNDSSCFVMFDSEETKKQAWDEISLLAACKIRPYTFTEQQTSRLGKPQHQHHYQGVRTQPANK